MERPVSLLASLVFVLGTSSVSACSEAPIGKEQLATICSEKAASTLNCSCFTDALQSSLAPEQFQKVAKAIDENRRFTGLVPDSVAGDASLGDSITQAQMSCTA